MKKWSFILSMILSFNAYAEIMSGTCGEDCHWKIDENRVLTIEGEGNMDDYQDKEDSPWFEERNRVSKIIISEGITNIGAKAFYAANPGSITVPNSVESIGDKAFYGLVARAQIYCQNTENRRCDTLINRKTEGQDRIVLYEIKGGVFILDGQYYLSGADMAGGTNVCAKELNECKRDVLEAKGVCQGSSCDTFIQSDGNYMLKFGGKTYQDINALLRGDYDRRRIYTIEEANFVAGDKNTVRIKYR